MERLKNIVQKIIDLFWKTVNRILDFIKARSWRFIRLLDIVQAFLESKHGSKIALISGISSGVIASFFFDLRAVNIVGVLVNSLLAALYWGFSARINVPKVPDGRDWEKKELLALTQVVSRSAQLNKFAAIFATFSAVSAILRDLLIKYPRPY